MEVGDIMYYVYLVGYRDDNSCFQNFNNKIRAFETDTKAFTCIEKLKRKYKKQYPKEISKLCVQCFAGYDFICALEREEEN